MSHKCPQILSYIRNISKDCYSILEKTSNSGKDGITRRSRQAAAKWSQLQYGWVTVGD